LYTNIVILIFLYLNVKKLYYYLLSHYYNHLYLINKGNTIIKHFIDFWTFEVFTVFIEANKNQFNFSNCSINFSFNGNYHLFLRLKIII